MPSLGQKVDVESYCNVIWNFADRINFQSHIALRLEKMIKAGRPVTRPPPHRSLRAVFPQRAPQAALVDRSSNRRM